MPALQRAARCDEILEQVQVDPKAEALALISVSGVRALSGRFAEWLTLAAKARTIYEDLGLYARRSAGPRTLRGSLKSSCGANLQQLRGSSVQAMRCSCVWVCEVRRGPALGVLFAEAICAQGRFAEAERLALAIEELQPEARPLRSVRAKSPGTGSVAWLEAEGAGTARWSRRNRAVRSHPRPAPEAALSLGEMC